MDGNWTVTDLGASDNSIAIALNDLGRAIGRTSVYDADGNFVMTTGFVWVDGVLTVQPGVGSNLAPASPRVSKEAPTQPEPLIRDLKWQESQSKLEIPENLRRPVEALTRNAADRGCSTRRVLRIEASMTGQLVERWATCEPISHETCSQHHPRLVDRQELPSGDVRANVPERRTDSRACSDGCFVKKAP